MSRLIKTLEAIVADVRRETGRSPDRNFGIDEYDSIKYLVQREQRRLWWDYQWRFLRKKVDLALVAGQRYYDMPGGISFERVTDVRLHFGNQWIPLVMGIDETDYSLYDSDNDQRANPALKWDMIDTSANPDVPAPQIEIWPIPVDAQNTRWTGIAELGIFVGDNDNCTLDAMLLTLFAAAKVNPADKDLLAAANKLLKTMEGSEQRRSNGNKINLNGEPSKLPMTARKRIVVIAAG